MIKALFLMMVFALTAPVYAQVEIKMRKLGHDDVRRLAQRGDHSIAREIAQQCAKQDSDTFCEFYLAQFMIDGKGGPKDELGGMALLKQSADKNNPAASAYLGNLHYLGRGVEESKSVALQYWTRSADHCNSWAQNAVARSFFDGTIVAQDFEKALYYAKLAAYFRFPNAKDGVAVIEQKLNPPLISSVEGRVEKFIRASGCGDKLPVMNFAP
jgi:Sel1 repeat